VGATVNVWRWLKTHRRFVDVLLLAAVLGMLTWRFGPQVGAALGLGGERTEIAGEGVRTLDGTVITLEDLRGRVVLVNLWATWCPPCVLEMPGFQRVYEDYRDQGFTVLGISRDDPGSETRVRAFLREKGITYPVAMQENTRIRGLGEIRSLPTSLLMGRDGTIRHRITGIYPAPTLRLAVKRLLDEG
jgi:thiol-disulfide isomerase/thioredoxin